MKKILFIGQFPPPIHGVSIMNELITKSNKINGHFRIKTFNLKFGKTIKDLNHFSFLKVIKAIAYSILLLKDMIFYKPELVYFTASTTGFSFYRDAFYVFLLKFWNVKILIHLHGKGVATNADRSYLKRFLYARFFNKTYVICLSKNLASDIKSVYKETPFILHNGIKVEPSSNNFKRVYDNSKSQILFLSHLKVSKGILIFIEALSLLKKNGYSFNARIVGSASELSIDNLNRLLFDNNLDSCVQIVGPLVGESKLNEYMISDIFVFPTFNEAFGLVILEAMQFGLPVVSTFEGSIPEIVIDNETGFLVEKGNPQILSDKIAILLRDESLRKKMGKNGYNHFIGNFTFERFEKNILNIYNNVLND
jgi:glycosyltransferase involved in cell wall biosynthesis